MTARILLCFRDEHPGGESIMLKRLTVVLGGAAICAFTASGVYAQDPPKQSDTKVVVQDDTAPKA
ncbi:MAG TPA: hypothetical protein VNR64_20775, partial [Vicinamibacterales bacterium]|nr:hypothetical protein [Vicinamibacterales bacterium]